ncbi:hypothetical protein SB783_38955 [Paraburkholderia sp. SIMBA_009]|uniref:hypothetical protein n=1 Tax=Paraburkholderia tropica TaxID=92647 RepID=UPI00161D9721|nr:hypothetical protein [Paraburkholderia tropica]MBB2984748.1 hypothetical protein [Paraburkholderia tropica]
MRTLIVEDDHEEKETWKREIEMHNAAAEEGGFVIEPTYAESLDGVRNAISIGNFDAAVVDIRLKLADGRAAPNTDGNDALREILQAEMAAVAVFTGEGALADKPENIRSTLRVFIKGGGENEGTSAVIAWLLQQVPMLRHIQAAQQVIHREMARIFTQSIWPRWMHWANDEEANANVRDAITRHITSHVYATLQEKGNQVAHPEEWYFVPPIRDGLRTGDLIEIDGTVEVVITPRCDLARPATKDDTVQLAVCEDVSVEWSERVTALEAATIALRETPVEHADRRKREENLNKAKQRLRQFTQHRSMTHLHFLPQMKLATRTIGPFMVRFDRIRSKERLSDDAAVRFPSARVAAITTEFLPSLVERLGTYFSRIGTPDYSHPEA